jgi:hypothetical protein
MDYACRATLAAFIAEEGRMDEWMARWALQQSALALDYCVQRLAPAAGAPGRAAGAAPAARGVSVEGIFLDWPPGAPVPIVKIRAFR